MAEQQCTKCGETKPLDKFGQTKDRGKVRHRKVCRLCYAAYSRTGRAEKRYRVDRAKDAARARRAKTKRMAAGRPAHSLWYKIKASVDRAAKQGKEYWPEGCRTGPKKDRYDYLVEQNARQAWRWWVQVKAPAWWVREAYRDKPWRNPRLTDTEQWRIQYWCDPLFRAKEIEKVQRLKVKRRERIDLTDDGTLTALTIMRLFAEAKCCTYCGKAMRSVEKSLDHVTPLMRGGSHSITNVVIACKACNYRKGRRTLAEWLAEAA